MKRVLIVDDSAFMRKALGTIFARNGFEIAAEAENGVVAVTKYQEVKPDLVTMDITMPEMDGLSTVKALKTLDPDCKIIVISAENQERMVREAIDLGAKAFIVKPFAEDAVIATVHAIFKS